MLQKASGLDGKFLLLVIVRVVDLIGQDVSGRRAQVRRRYDWSDWRPVWRVLKSVAMDKTGMVYLRWIPEDGAKNMGHIDCGYSGRGIEIADDWTIEMDPT